MIPHQPYQPAPPKAVLSFMAALYVAAGQPAAAEAYISELLTMLAVQRSSTCEGQR